MKGFLMLIMIYSVASAAEVEVKILKTTARTSPQEKKVLEKKLSKRINGPKASGTSR